MELTLRSSSNVPTPRLSSFFLLYPYINIQVKDLIGHLEACAQLLGQSLRPWIGVNTVIGGPWNLMECGKDSNKGKTGREQDAKLRRKGYWEKQQKSRDIYAVLENENYSLSQAS